MFRFVFTQKPLDCLCAAVFGIAAVGCELDLHTVVALFVLLQRCAQVIIFGLRGLQIKSSKIVITFRRSASLPCVFKLALPELGWDIGVA